MEGPHLPASGRQRGSSQSRRGLCTPLHGRGWGWSCWRPTGGPAHGHESGAVPVGSARAGRAPALRAEGRLGRGQQGASSNVAVTSQIAERLSVGTRASEPRPPHIVTSVTCMTRSHRGIPAVWAPVPPPRWAFARAGPLVGHSRPSPCVTWGHVRSLGGSLCHLGPREVTGRVPVSPGTLGGHRAGPCVTWGPGRSPGGSLCHLGPWEVTGRVPVSPGALGGHRAGPCVTWGPGGSPGGSLCHLGPWGDTGRVPLMASLPTLLH